MALIDMDFALGSGGGVSELYNDSPNLTLNTWYSTGIKPNDSITIATVSNTGLIVYGSFKIENGNITTLFSNYIECRLNNGEIEIRRTYQSGNVGIWIYG